MKLERRASGLVVPQTKPEPPKRLSGKGSLHMTIFELREYIETRVDVWWLVVIFAGLCVWAYWMGRKK